MYVSSFRAGDARSSKQKARSKRAALLQEIKLVNFMVVTMEEAVARIIQQYDILTLSAQAILLLPASSSTFLRAVDNYQQQIEEH